MTREYRTMTREYRTMTREYRTMTREFRTMTRDYRTMTRVRTSELVSIRVLMAWAYSSNLFEFIQPIKEEGNVTPSNIAS